MYQPYITESSLTPYHIPPPASSTTATGKSDGESHSRTKRERRSSSNGAMNLLAVIGSAKVIADREVMDGRQREREQVVAAALTTSPPLELRKKSSPQNRLNDSPLITSPYVQSSRGFFYDEPIQAHRPLPPSRSRVSTPPYASKVPQQGEPVDMFVPTQSRLHMETTMSSRYGGSAVITSHDDGGILDNEILARPYTDAYVSHVSIPDSALVPSTDTELDYSRRRVVRLRDDETTASRDSSPSQMDSPPLGDSPPQGNLDGTVLVVRVIFFFCNVSLFTK